MEDLLLFRQLCPPHILILFLFSAETLVSLTIPTILAALFDQTAFQRTASAKSEKAAVRGHIYGGLLLIVMAIIPPLLGMYGIALFPNVDPASVFIDLFFIASLLSLVHF